MSVRVAAVGGGHGLSRALAALRALDLAPTAVVTVADDGGSSGRLRRELGIIPPGDLRMALLTLARNRPLAEAFAHRFERGQLEGHALGNLLLVALAERTAGDFVAALEAAGDLLHAAGRVLPATAASVQLKAWVGGEEVGGQAAVARARGRIERVWLEPEAPPACGAAVDALRAADVIVLGPGSLFTSIIAALLVPDIAAAVADGGARVVYVGNVLTQPGETSGLDARAHVAALLANVDGLRLDLVLLHDGPVPPGPGTRLGTDLGDLAVGRVVCGDLVRRDDDGAPCYDHDPQRLADALRPLLAG
jgi:uncharacterized cofD-like protein